MSKWLAPQGRAFGVRERLSLPDCPLILRSKMATLLRLLDADEPIRRFPCERSSPRGLCHAAQKCRATASALLGAPHHPRSSFDHETHRGSVQAINPVAARLLRHASDGTPVGSAIGIEQRTPFPRRGRCASTPGLHDGTASRFDGRWERKTCMAGPRGVPITDHRASTSSGPF